MQITYVPMLAQVFASILHIFWCYLFIYVLKFDVVGLSYAENLT